MTPKPKTDGRAPAREDSSAADARSGGQEPERSRWGRRVRNLVLGTAVAGTLLAIWFQWTFFTHAGALWRDEVDTVNVASMPTLSDVWGNTKFNLMPMLWFVLLRGWVGAGGGGDMALRALGLLIGLGTLGVLWFSIRRLGGIAPLLTLALFALGPEVIRRGAAVRAHGLGGILLLLATVLMWEMIKSPTPWRVAWAAVASILCVQTVYHNAVLLAAAGVGALAIALRRRQWRRALLPIGVGLAAGISFIPYLLKFRDVAAWSELVKADLAWPDVWGAFCESMGPGLEYLGWFWPAVVLLTLAAVAFCQIRRWSPELSDDQRDTALYLGILLVTGTAAYAFFLKAVNYRPNPWHFYGWLGFAAVCADGTVGVLARSKAWTLIRVAGLCTLAILAFGATDRAMKVRLTNVDSVAAILNKETVKGDLIVLNPWTWGITFDRYYHGEADWMTVPNVEDRRTHRYDQVLAKMKLPNAVADIQQAMTKALRSGRRVWVLGMINPFPPHQMDGQLPATDDERTWKRVRYLTRDPQTGRIAIGVGPTYYGWWCAQIGEVPVQGGAAPFARSEDVSLAQLNQMPLPPRTMVSAVTDINETTVGIHPFEIVPGVVLWGWQEPPARPGR